jgi:hypothetical protein
LCIKRLNTNVPTLCEDSTSNETFIPLSWSHQRPSATNLLPFKHYRMQQSAIRHCTHRAGAQGWTAAPRETSYPTTAWLAASCLDPHWRSTELTCQVEHRPTPERMRSPISSRRFSVSPLQSGYRFVSRAQLECELICYKSIWAITHHNNLNRGSEANYLTISILVTSMYMGK